MQKRFDIVAHVNRLTLPGEPWTAEVCVTCGVPLLADEEIIPVNNVGHACCQYCAQVTRRDA